MAIRKIDSNTSSAVWNNKVMFPKQTYTLRCIEETVTYSSAGNPMVTLGWEICDCEPIKIGDKMFEFAGVKFTSYHVLRVNNAETAEDNEKASNKAFAGYQDRVLIPCGIDVSEGWDDENPPSVKGKKVYASVYGKENKSYCSPTSEERAKGIKIGKPMIDPITNKEVVVYQPQIETIFGLCQ